MLKTAAISILLFVGGLMQVCYATVSLSVNPVDGSNTLRFGRSPMAADENNKEIHIRVASTDGSRYQVFQRIVEPIMDDKGNTLNLQAMGTQTISNTNSYGTLYLQNSDHLSTGDQLLYSSSQSGQNDGFIVGYTINKSLINTSGSFRGRLVFTVRGVGNGSSDQATIDVFLETSPSLKISVKGAHNPNRIRIKGSDTTRNAADYLSVSFSGNSGQEIRIYQEVEAFPKNELDQDLGKNVLQLDAQGASDALRMGGIASLGFGRTLIYSSNKDEDNFVIYFLADTTAVNGQDAGDYKGKLKYVIETDQGRQEFPIEIECAISPIFSVNVTPPPGGVSFSHVLANSPPQDKEVLVTIVSNLHKPYQVLQDLQSNMMNQQGKEFNSKYFTVQVEIPPDQSGHTDYVEFAPVKTGEYPVFSSDASGRGVTFKVVYRLQGYTQMDPGNFSAPIRFSLNQK